MNTKYIVVTGGVASGIGKGTIASSIGLLLQSHGLCVSAIKIDPYLNVDAGKMSPHEHGEVYVLADGTECDLDLGNYERFLGINLTRNHSITTGQIYTEVIEKERNGDYLGHTVQIVPHITDHILSRIEKAAAIPVANRLGVKQIPDIVVIELGGTVGDMESEPFLYTISRLALNKDVFILHVGLLVTNNGEHKTKPLQHSLQSLRARGVFPDVLCVRSDVQGEPVGIRTKLAFGCHMQPSQVIFSGRVNTIYEVPNLLYNQSLCNLIDNRIKLSLNADQVDLTRYYNILNYFTTLPSKSRLKVGIVAKYTGSPDTYLSLTRALEHSAFLVDYALDVQFIAADSSDTFDTTFNGIIIPGGFGDRGIEGKIKAITNARNANIPVLGLCLGMQLLAIEEARHIGLLEANSTEFQSDTPYPIVSMINGGNMRLGDQMVFIKSNTIASRIYSQQQRVIERHRHRYHVKLSEAEFLNVSGVSESGIPEIIEFPANTLKWRAIGVQFHPEYISRNNLPHPLFVEFLKRIVLKNGRGV